MSGSLDDPNPLEMLVEEFLERRRRGERPTIEDYAARFPALAEEVRAVFPALLAVEELKPGSDEFTLSRADRAIRPGAHTRPSGWAITVLSARSAGAGWASSTRPSRSRWAAGSP